MAELPKLLPAKQISARNVTIGETADNLDKLVFENAIQCALHAQQHGDVTLMADLLNRVGGTKRKGFNAEGFIKWVYDHTPIRDGGKDAKGNRALGLLKRGINKDFPAKPDEPDSVAWKIEEMIATPYWNYAPSAPPRARPPLSADEIQNNIIKFADRIETAVKQDKFEGGEGEARKAMTALAAAVKAYNEAMRTMQEAPDTAHLRDPRREEHPSFNQPVAGTA
jgi:hypothetical protein